MDNSKEWLDPNDAKYLQNEKEKAYKNELRRPLNQIDARIKGILGNLDWLSAQQKEAYWRWRMPKEHVRDGLGTVGIRMQALLKEIHQQLEVIEEEEELDDEEEE